MHHASQILDEIQAKHKEVIEMMKGMGGDKDGNNNIQTSEIFGEDSEKNKSKVGTMLHCYNSSLQLLPKGYKIPDMTLSQLITMWLCGDQASGVPPYRLLKRLSLFYII